MRVSFEIEDLADAEAAVGQVLALIDAFRLLEDPNSFDQMKAESIAAATPPVVAKVKDPPIKKRTKKPVDEPAKNPRDALTAIAREKGVLWVREVLERYNVGRLSELTDEQVLEVLRDAA